MDNTGAQDRPPLLAALHGQTPDRLPIWLMRQAGRYLPEYRALREKSGGFLAMCDAPAVAAEITLQPIRRYDLDAAIIFSDILLIPRALGQDLWFVAGEGPRLTPITDAAAVAALRRDGMEDRLTPVYEAIARVKAALPRHVALLGFAGAPWTLAAYMVKGQGGDFLGVRAMAARDPVAFQSLLDLLADAVADHLAAQIDAGCDAVQLFDSWAGQVPASQFETLVIAPTQRVLARLKARHPQVPVIGFARQAGLHLAHYAAESGVDVVALDQAVPPRWAHTHLQPRFPVQGNLDPALLVAGGSAMAQAVRQICDALAGGPFVFNLGHGVVPETPPEHVAALIEQVHGVAPGQPADLS